jgi:hypothetical protein
MAGPRTLKRTQRAVNAYRDLRRAVAKLTVLHDKQLRGFQLTATQYDLLEALLYAGPATLTEVAERILCTQSNATVVAGNCVKRGWIVLRTQGKRPAQTEGPSDAGGTEAHRDGVSAVREDGPGADGRAQLLAAAGAEPVVSKAG